MYKKQFVTILATFSCFVNACLWGKRHEMLSSRSWRVSHVEGDSSFWKCVVVVLDLVFGHGHCRVCYEHELKYFDGIQD